MDVIATFPYLARVLTSPSPSILNIVIVHPCQVDRHPYLSEDIAIIRHACVQAQTTSLGYRHRPSLHKWS